MKRSSANLEHGRAPPRATRKRLGAHREPVRFGVTGGNVIGESLREPALHWWLDKAREPLTYGRSPFVPLTFERTDSRAIEKVMAELVEQWKRSAPTIILGERPGTGSLEASTETQEAIARVGSRSGAITGNRADLLVFDELPAQEWFRYPSNKRTHPRR